MHDRTTRRVALALFATAALLYLGSASTSSSVATPRVTRFGVIRELEVGATLRLVQVVHRHGARAPLNTAYWPDTQWDVCSKEYEGVQLSLRNSDGGAPPPWNDAEAAQLPGGCRMGQLTQFGYEQARDLGRYLRHAYVDHHGFMPEHYQPGSIFTKTTAFTRTYNTLKGVLTGLYPDTTASIPVNTTVEADEYMYGHDANCRKVGALERQLEAAVNATETADDRLSRLADMVRTALQLPAAQPVEWGHLRDTLAAMRAAEIAWPPGVEGHVWDVIRTEATRHEAAVKAPERHACPSDADVCEEVLRLSIGPLLWRLLHNMRAAVRCNDAHEHAQPAAAAVGEQAVVEEASDAVSGAAALMEDASASSASCGPQMFIYSGHDTTIMPLLATLDQHVTEWPAFASSVIVELWHRNGAHHAASSSSAAGVEAGSSSSRSGGRHFVRLYYQREPLEFGRVVELPLDVLQHEVLSKFVMDDVTHHQACDA